MRQVILTLTVALVTAGLCAGPPADDPLLGWMDRIAQRQLDRREKAIAEIRALMVERRM